MRKPPVPYKHAGETDTNYGKTADSSLLAKKRQNFEDGGSVNPSVDRLKEMIADLKLDAPFKAAQATASSGSNAYSDDGSQWESQQTRFDKDGMPMRRVLRTPYGNIPLKGFAKGGAVKKGK